MSGKFPQFERAWKKSSRLSGEPRQVYTDSMLLFVEMLAAQMKLDSVLLDRLEPSDTALEALRSEFDVYPWWRPPASPRRKRGLFLDVTNAPERSDAAKAARKRKALEAWFDAPSHDLFSGDDFDPLLLFDSAGFP